MSIEVKYRKSKLKVDWNWPVQIGFLKELGARALISDFKRHYWLEQLTHAYQISRVRSKANILVLNGNPKKIERILRNYPFLIKTDLLVIFLEPGSRLNAKQVTEQLHQVACNSFFLSVLRENDSPLDWLNAVIYELSHNATVQEAIRKVNWEGTLVTSKELLREGRVSRSFDKLLDKIRKSNRSEKYRLEKVLTEEIRNRIDWHSATYRGSTEVPVTDIITDIERKKATFEYNQESQEASTIRDITINHSANSSSMLESIESTQAKEADPGTDRFLQCAFHDQQKQPAQHALLVDHTYTFTVKIGPPDEDFLLGSKVTNEDVAVSTDKGERVDLLVRYRGKLEQKHLTLPASGMSTEAVFDINIPEEGETQFELFAFHKNRLFQQIDLSVFFCRNERAFSTVPSIKVEQINMPRLGFSDFDLKEEYGLSIVATDGLPIIAQRAKITEIRDEDQITRLNEELQAVIERYVKSPDPDDDELILSLANKGASLFKALFDNDEVFEQPIQIISPSKRHFPLEFVYTYKLGRKATKLCPKAFTEPKNSACENCQENRSQYICPFGFAALRTIIERHDVGENANLIGRDSIGLMTDVNMNRPALKILSNTLFGSSSRLKDLRVSFSDKVKASSVKAVEATNWDEWEQGVEGEPDSLILISHVKTPINEGAPRELEIGNDFMREGAIDNEHVRKGKASMEPFVILIGCNTQDVEMSFMDFASAFKRSGAAIVLSTFTKIRASQAVPLVEQLLDILKSNGSGNAVRFGTAMLQLRRQLFAQGIYVSMALVAHGDADWKLKI